MCCKASAVADFHEGCEVVHITVLTAGYTNVGSSSGQYLCYRSDQDTDATLLFGRTAPITTDISPPPDVGHSLPIVRRVIFPTGGEWNNDGFGPFYCEASKPDRDVTRVTTFFQRNDAKFISSDGLFTKTVNVNETGVMISMTRRFDPDAHDNVITWMKDGSEVLTSFRGQTEISFPNPIQTSDQGIYEIYYDNKRNQNRGGLYRLIVRECPAGKWGPPECYGICDKCYNGGVCDDKSGLCICPNNFKGPNCLEICRSDGGNRFGWNCEFRCSYRSPVPATQCHGLLFCLPDPYGCSCDVGAHGLACNTLCTIGTYGPGCSQTCHCAGGGSSCDIYSGICAGECQTGWSGDNCQIPDECVDGYYGSQCTDKCHCLNDEPCDKDTGECPEQKCALGYKVRSGQVKCQECEGGTFGLDCVQQCHCAPEACEKERGLCKGQCLDSWIEPYCQRISRLVPVRVNPYRPSSFTCFVEGILLPDEASVDLYRRTGSTNDRTGITRRSTTVSGSERAVVFDVASVFPEEYGEYVCTFTVENTGYPSTSNINPTFGEQIA
ncbi:tyrosine-protein kinase receptor Tie-2-like [Strongylocentrotus purpuratus]|uniref:Ig-like domain-containing protein n=1 Tax=Strongylocentrotus purpuratus TaxID=7668 RepID=A0A7M7PIN2_STRPU|nr:tyrosine-protein kinase receptor Tie-2-like [Strongylocentrotus purpuratus]